MGRARGPVLPRSPSRPPNTTSLRSHHTCTHAQTPNQPRTHPPPPQVAIRPDVASLFLETRPPEEPGELVAAVERLGQRSALKNVDRKVKVRGARTAAARCSLNPAAPAGPRGRAASGARLARARAAALDLGPGRPASTWDQGGRPRHGTRAAGLAAGCSRTAGRGRNSPRTRMNAPCSQKWPVAYTSCSGPVPHQPCARRPRPRPRPQQVAMPEKDKKARKRRQQAPRTVTNVHLPQLFQGAAPETIDS
jgi:hypothetical protein